MSTIDQIEEAIQKLSDQDLALFRAWFVEFDAAVWDQKFERDARAGRLDSLAEEALDDLREGQCSDL